MPRVLHLNTYDGNGGAGKACLRLNNALQKQGVDSKILVHYKFGQNPLVKSFDNNIFQKSITAAKIILERVLGRRYLKAGSRTPFSFTWFGRDVSNHPDVKSADIIHLHWINHTFLNPASLKKLAKLNKPIVWTFHDSNAFTGGCHVRYTCDHYRHSCGFCPLLEKPHESDLSRKIWLQKESAYQQLKFTIIAPSSWMLRSIAESGLLNTRPAKILPNTLDTDVFKPRDRDALLTEFGLDATKIYFLSGFMPSRKDLHKGTDYLLDSLKRLVTDSAINTSNVELLIFGNRTTTDLPVFPFPTKFLGTIGDEETLAKYYAVAHAFLIPSLEDNLPYTVMESLSCGTPVIAFTTGGIPDMVKHEENGYLATYKSAESLCRGMSWIITHGNLQQLQNNARETVMEHFSEQRIADRHIAMYEEVIAETPNINANA
ncbi:glycosyltransferase [Mucilaginibacter ginkgonis]|uniref:glycosyltransferase n=1 Tax=Mucilaginibacter ginkgonis TaxID=2682091 RepID=UPI001FC8AA4F|nr:glycosyltransferase [Mucilaginibacter ginkgonis]